MSEETPLDASDHEQAAWLKDRMTRFFDDVMALVADVPDQFHDDPVTEAIAKIKYLKDKLPSSARRRASPSRGSRQRD